MEFEPCHGIVSQHMEKTTQFMCNFSNRLIAHSQGYIVVSFLGS